MNIEFFPVYFVINIDLEKVLERIQDRLILGLKYNRILKYFFHSKISR